LRPCFHWCNPHPLRQIIRFRLFLQGLHIYFNCRCSGTFRWSSLPCHDLLLRVTLFFEPKGFILFVYCSSPFWSLFDSRLDFHSLYSMITNLLSDMLVPFIEHHE
jgi:hypothetical protein